MNDQQASRRQYSTSRLIAIVNFAVFLTAVSVLCWMLYDSAQMNARIREDQSKLSTVEALRNQHRTTTPFPLPSNVTATPVPDPTPTIVKDPQPYTVGPIDFADSKRMIMMSIKLDGGNEIFIPPFRSYDWAAVTETEHDLFAASLNTGVAWKPDGLNLGLWLHSGRLNNQGLTMWDLQEYVEVNEAGNVRSGPEMDDALESLIGRRVVVMQYHEGCEFQFDAPTCDFAEFRIISAFRISPHLVADSQRYLVDGAGQWLSSNVEDSRSYLLNGPDTFFIRTCGRQAAGEDAEPNRPYWQQSRLVIGLQLIEGDPYVGP